MKAVKSKLWPIGFRRGNRFIAAGAIAVFVIAFLWSGVVRYRSGLNQSPIQVCLPSEYASRGVEVRIESLWGSIDSMKVISSGEKKIWTTLSSRPAVTAIYLATSLPPEPATIEVRCGTSWHDHWRILRPITIDRIAESQGDLWRLGFESQSRSFIPRFSRVLNWQGDVWLVIVPLCHALLLSTAACIVLICFCSADGDRRLEKPGFFMDSVVNAWGVASAMFVTSMMTLVFERLMHSGNPRVLLCSVGIAGCLAAGFVSGCAAIQRLQLRRHRSALNVIAWFGTLLVLGFRLAVANSSDVIAIGDFKDYGTVGAGFVNGTVLRDWDFDYALLPIIARRAYSFVAPVVWLFGEGKSIAFANCVVQLITAWLTAWLVSRSRMATFGSAIFAGVAVLLWPDFLYATMLPSHDIAGFFWMSCAFCLVFRLQGAVQEENGELANVSFVRVSGMLFGAALLGFCVNMLEWTRGFGPFFISGVAFGLVVYGRGHGHRSSKRRTVRLLLLYGLSIGFMVLFSQLMEANYRKQAGDSDDPGFREYLAAVSTRSDGTWSGMSPFRFNYWRQIPEGRRIDFFLRKVTHEKLVRIREVPAHLWRKTHHLSRNDDYPLNVLGVDEASQGTVFGMGALNFHTVLADVLCFILLSVLLGAIILSSLNGLSLVECLVYSTASVILVAVLCLTEVAGTYDGVLGLACAVGCSRVLLALVQPGCVDAEVWTSVNRLVPASIRGLAVLSLIGLFCSVSGFFLAKAGVTFVDCRSCSVQLQGNREQFESAADDVSVKLACRTLQHLPSGDRSGRVIFQFPGQPGENVSLFLSADQYASAFPGRNRTTVGLAEFRLIHDGRLLAAGDLADLNSPKWIEFERGEGGACELVMDLSEGMDPSLEAPLPVVAVEFMCRGI